MVRVFSRWLRDNADPIAALVAAMVLCVLDLVGVSSYDLVAKGMFAVLALVALALMHDRWDRGNLHTRLDSVAAALDERLDVLARTESVLDRAELAAGEMEAALRQVRDDIRENLQGVASLEAATSERITRELERARRATDCWYFRGGTGTYLREVTLPELVENARRSQTELDLTIEIIDPRRAQLCERYALSWSRYSPTPDPSGEPWTVERVQRESYATILAACWHRERFDLLKIQVGLAATWNPPRIDISRSTVIVTQDDASVPGQVIRSDSFLYGFYRSQVRETLAQADEVPLRLARSNPLGPAPAAADVRYLFQALGIPLEDLELSSDRNVESIMLKAGLDVLVPQS